jgi:hypothetical protein
MWQKLKNDIGPMYVVGNTVKETGIGTGCQYSKRNWSELQNRSFDLTAKHVCKTEQTVWKRKHSVRTRVKRLGEFFDYWASFRFLDIFSKSYKISQNFVCIRSL